MSTTNKKLNKKKTEKKNIKVKVIIILKSDKILKINYDVLIKKNEKFCIN